jgi:hypothetical protein
MSWRKQSRDCKLAWALLLILAICGQTARAVEPSPHVDPPTPVPTQITVTVPSISGANVAVGVYSWNSPVALPK